MARLQNIMDSLEPAVMGKVEGVIAKHELQLNSEAKIRMTWTGYFEGILSQLEHMQRARERYGDLIGISKLEREALHGGRRIGL